MTKNITLRPPVSYQGGKQRLSKEIVDIILKDNVVDADTVFYDLCSGSGAVSLELVNRGVSPENIVMVEIGVYGYFWKLVSTGGFNFNKFKQEAKKVPKDKSKVKKYMEELSNSPIYDMEDMVYKYLILQASSFGGKQISVDYKAMRWDTASFRNYWQPTPTSNRRSPVNPMQPMTETIVKRVDSILKEELNFNVMNDDIYESLNLFKDYNDNAIIYIDPPYKNTSGYKDCFDWEDFLGELFNTVSSPIYVSECAKYSDDAVLLNFNNRKGGISGKKKKGKKEEWLNIFK